MDEKYEPLRLRNQLCFPIYLCAKELTRRYQPMLDELNLTYTQYVVMMHMWEARQANVSAISKALTLDPSTLTPILKKLEGKGYIARARDPEDERNLVITLTDEGLCLRDRAIDIPQRMGACLGLSEEEAIALYTLIHKALTNIEKEL